MCTTDGALAAFVRGIERTPDASRSIFVVWADRATTDQPLWGGELTNNAMAKVPSFIYFPSTLIEIFEGSSERGEGEVTCAERNLR
jgi:hypothetical protein